MSACTNGIYDIRFLHRMPLPLAIHFCAIHFRHSYLLCLDCFVVVSGLHQKFSVLGRHFLPWPQRNPVLLWILPRDGNATAAAEDVKITRSQINIKFRKTLTKNFQQKQFSFDTEHSIRFSDKFAATRLF